MTSMGSISNNINRADTMDENTTDRGETFVSPVQAQQEFHQDLESAVHKHYRYLREIAEMTKAELPGWYSVIKRSMDMLVGIGGLVLLSPLFFVVAILIKLDSRGTVFFKQERVGKNGELFMMYKFRTMVANAEKRTGPVWAVENDPRLTFIGRILRKSKIDEFPQLLNLVKGNMTIVGPRPERPFFVNHFMEHIPGYARRLDVIPGITGLAQIKNGYDRSAEDVINKLRYDVTYIQKMGLFMDIRICVETFMAMLTGKA